MCAGAGAGKAECEGAQASRAGSLPPRRFPLQLIGTQGLNLLPQLPHPLALTSLGFCPIFLGQWDGGAE